MLRPCLNHRPKQPDIPTPDERIPIGPTDVIDG